MEPALPDGATIRIDPRKDGDVLVGGIAVCANGPKLIAHRVVYSGASIRTRSFALTQGDNCLMCDPPVRKDMILGTVQSVHLEGGWHEPAGTPALQGWRRLAAAASRYLVLGCLYLHHQVALFVARVLIAAEHKFGRPLE
jgi:hypothetical protein